MVLWLLGAFVLFLAVIALFYFALKSRSAHNPQEMGYISTRFLKLQQSSAAHIKSFKFLKTKQPALEKCNVLQGEDKEVFMLLHSMLPLTHVSIFPCIPLRLFMVPEYDELEYCVGFLIVGNKSLSPLVAIDYFDENDEDGRVVCASKKLLLKQAKIPYLLISRQKFLTQDALNTTELQTWLQEHLVSKFKTKPQ